jgi:hypothetical protein
LDAFLLTEDLANLEQNHTTQRPNRDQYLPPKEENTESAMKLWFYEQRLRQIENENVRINARLDKLEIFGINRRTIYIFLCSIPISSPSSI